ncbi:putative RNA-binding protein [Coniochaeta sp. 2T2.1]|nr:putative RNA-binding protein [Coniochaeta sp. 2T2.1]
MPAELRKRKEKAPAAKVEDMPPAKKAAKAAPAPKRKAAEDASVASPIAAKKQKPVKEAAAEKPVKKSKAKKEEPVEEPEVAENEEEVEEVEEADDRTKDLMARFDSDDSDDETTTKSTFKEGQDVGKIPKAKKADSKPVTEGKQAGTGTVYVGRIPHGFYEHEMRQYFSQFGPITRLRLSRNKKTGASKHFAFIEFADAATAEVVSKTMDGYLLFGHILRCKLVPESQIHDGLWKGANRRFKKVPWNKMAGKQLERPLSESKWEAKISKEERRRSARAEKLKEMDYEFEAPALKAAEAKPKAVEAAEEPKAIEAPAAEVETKEVGKDAEPATEEKPEETAEATEETPTKETKKAKGASKKKGKKSKA